MNQRHRAATRIRLRIPPDGSLAGPVLMLPPGAYINVADSIIEAESVLALAAFFFWYSALLRFYLGGVE